MSPLFSFFSSANAKVVTVAAPLGGVDQHPVDIVDDAGFAHDFVVLSEETESFSDVDSEREEAEPENVAGKVEIASASSGVLVPDAAPTEIDVQQLEAPASDLANSTRSLESSASDLPNSTRSLELSASDLSSATRSLSSDDSSESDTVASESSIYSSVEEGSEVATEKNPSSNSNPDIANLADILEEESQLDINHSPRVANRDRAFESLQDFDKLPMAQQDKVLQYFTFASDRDFERVVNRLKNENIINLMVLEILPFELLSHVEFNDNLFDRFLRRINSSNIYKLLVDGRLDVDAAIFDSSEEFAEIVREVESARAPFGWLNDLACLFR